MVLMIFVLVVLLAILFLLRNQRQHKIEKGATIRHLDASVVYEFTRQSNKSDILGQDLIILDVRSSREYRRGHIRKALNFDYLDPDFNINIRQLDKARSYIVCAEGSSRSMKAIEVLQKNGFVDLSIMTGGMLEWSMQDFPLEK